MTDRRLRVLLVDDDAFLVKAVVRLLSRVLDVTPAVGGEAGLEALAREAAFDVVLFDMQMPPMHGPDFYTRARAARPELPSAWVVMSGDLDAPDLRRFVQSEGLRAIRKPFTLQQILEALEALRR